MIWPVSRGKSGDAFWGWSIPCRKQIAGWPSLLCILMLLIAFSPSAVAQQLPRAGVDDETREGDDKPLADNLGTSVRRIYFYHSQEVKLVPATFWPVAIEELEAALNRRSESTDRFEDRPNLASSVYVARYAAGALISDADASTLDITYRNDQPGSLALGRMNLAIESQVATGGSTRFGRLVTDADGIVRAIVDQDCRLRFGWSRNGLPAPGGRFEFDLEIPPCGRTRFIIGMPSGTSLQARDGVLTSLPSPPPEASNVVGQKTLSWYSIEAGGLSRVRLSVQERVENRPVEQRYSLRKLGLDCVATRRGLDWTARLVLDVPRGAAIPQLLVSGGGRITDVRVNDAAVRWQELTRPGSDSVASQKANGNVRSESSAPLPPNATIELSVGNLPIESRAALNGAGASASSANSTLAITMDINGTVSSEDFYGQFAESALVPLPWIRIGQPRTTSAYAESELLLRVGAGVQLAEVVDNVGWRIDEVSGGATTDTNVVDDVNRDTANLNRQTTNPTRTYRLVGSPAERPPTIRCVATEFLGQSLATLRLDVVTDGLRAVWDAYIAARADSPEPLVFEIEPEWQIDAVEIRTSGRTVEMRDQAAGQFALWPEPGDIVDGAVRLRITGVRARETEGSSQGLAEVVPKSWFIRSKNLMLRSFAAIVPPTEYEWVAGTALAGEIIEASQLPEMAADMLGPVVGDTLLFSANNGETPALELARPPAAFNSDVQFDLRLDGEDVVERLQVDFRVPAGRLPNVRIHLGDTGNRPPMRWSILRSGTTNRNGSGRESLDQLDSTPNTGTLQSKRIEDATRVVPDEIWELEPSGGIQDGLTLVAERRYSPATNEIGIPLPSLPVMQLPQGATNRATVAVGSGLDLLLTEGEVLRVPRSSTETTKSFPIAWMLRYDPSETAEIRLGIAPGKNSLPVIWQQRTDILAGTAGDEIAVEFRVDSELPVEITFDPSIVVTRVDGVVFNSSEERPGRLVVGPQQDLDRFEIFMWRPIQSGAIVRQSAAPEIQVNGVVMRRMVRLWPAADTIALVPGEIAIEPSWMTGEARGVSARLTLGQKVWLLPSGLAWAMGGGAALVVFGVGWLLVRRLTWLVFSGMLSVGMIAILIPVWGTSLLGFLVIPLAAAGLTVSSVEARRTSGRNAGKNGSNEGSSPSKHSNGGGFIDPLAPTETHKHQVLDSPSGKSLEQSPSKSKGSGLATFLSVLLGLFITVPHGQTGHAQDEAATGSQRPTAVMIPVDEKGDMVGNRVYVPKPLIDLLFRPKPLEEQLGIIEFQSANYDVRVSSSGMRDVSDSVTVEAVWRVEFESASQLVRLPIDPATLDRLEVVVDSVANEIRPQPDGDSVLVRPPKAGINVLRAVLTPVVETNVAGSGRIALKIPQVANSSVTVTPDTPLDQIGLPQCLGRINRFDSGSRVTASLGPVEFLELIWQRRGALASDTTASLRRRWWVYAGEGTLCRELELDVGRGVRGGVTVELTGEPPGTPQLTTTDWTFAQGEGGETSRNRLRLVATLDKPGPIRLLWSDSVTNLADSSIVLPNVRPVSQSGPIETWIGVDLPAGWRVASTTSAPIVDVRTGGLVVGSSSDINGDGAIGDSASSGELNSTESRAAPAMDDQNTFQFLETNEFSAAWRGYRGAIDFARRHPGPGTITLRVTAPATSVWTANVSHYLLVSDSQLQINYVASITPAATPSGPLSLMMPVGFHAEQILINGRLLDQVSASRQLSQVASPSEGGPSLNSPQREILLPSLESNLMTEIRVVGTIPLPPNRQFSIPRILVHGLSVVDERYVMSRTDGLRVRELKEPRGVVAIGGGAEYDLTSGTVPLRSWGMASASEPMSDIAVATDDKFEGGRFRVSAVGDRFAATTLTTLRWNDGVWTMEFLVDVEEFAGLTDFLTFKVPTRWVDSLDVQPAAKWSSQPSTEPGSHLVRVLPPTSTVDRIITSSESVAANPRKMRLRITSRLENAGDGGVSVPQIQLLGGGKRTRYFAVPKRLTTSPIVWQVQNARAEPIPATIYEIAPPRETHVIYEALGDAYTARLEPAPVGLDSARSPFVHVALFNGSQQQQKTTGLMRLLLLPGDRDSITFQIPSGCKLLGAWAAGTPVGIGNWETSESEPVQGMSLVRLPLALSRLADQVVLMFEVDVPQDADKFAIPKPIDLPVAQTWVGRFDEATTIGIGRDTSIGKAASTLSALSTFPSGKHFLGVLDDDAGMAASRSRSAANEELRQHTVDAIIELLDASVDSAAERPAAEKREWLRPWFARLRALGWTPSQPLGMSTEVPPSELADDSEEPPSGTSVSNTERADQSPTTNIQQVLDAWAPKFFQRVFGTDSIPKEFVDGQPKGRWLDMPPAWEAGQQMEFADPDQEPLGEIPRVMIPEPLRMRAFPDHLHWGLWGGVAVLFVSAIVVFFLGSRLLLRPSIWLFALGISSLGLAPLPVSIAAMLLAIAAGVLPKR